MEVVKKKRNMNQYGDKNPSARKVIDTDSGHIYFTVKDAADAEGITSNQLIYRMTKGTRIKTNLRYYIPPRTNRHLN